MDLKAQSHVLAALILQKDTRYSLCDHRVSYVLCSSCLSQEFNSAFT
jgi:hypothetical protein